MKSDIAWYLPDPEDADALTLESVNDLCLEAIDMLDDRRHTLSLRVVDLCMAIARQLELSHITRSMLEMAARVHRVGELYLSAEIEDKCFLDLSTRELSAYCNYPVLSGLKVTHCDEHPLFQILINHREYVAGKGFRNRNSGHDIPLASRILCAATEYEELIMYRGRTPAEQGMVQEFMVTNLAGRYDEEVVKALMVTLAAQSVKH